MNIINDDAAQTSVEMILLFGGIIAVVVGAALFYNSYLKGLGNGISGTDLTNTLNSINGLSTKLK
jgi:ABC-type transporter Mla subunit MlaD